MKKHRNVSAIILAGLMLGVLLRVISGCAASGESTTVQQSGSAANPQAELQIPESVPPALWDLLNEELQRQLELHPPRSASAAPQSLLSQSMLTLSNETQLDWDYRSQGDYDQNGEVNVADLVPLAIHFHESALPNLFPPDLIQSVVDGDNNGEINLADVQPIAVNFHNTVSFYRLYRSLNPDDYPAEDPTGGNGSAQQWQEIPFANSLGNPAAQRLRFEFELPEQREGDYLWVRPVHSVEGIASTLAGPVPPPLFSISGRIVSEYYETPVGGMTVELRGDVSRDAVTAEDGSYLFEGIHDGMYTVGVEQDGWEFNPPQYEFQLDGQDIPLLDIHGALVNVLHTWGTGDSEPADVVSTNASGEILVSGVLFPVPQPDPFNSDIFIYKLDDTGRLKWYRRWDSGYHDTIQPKAVLTSSGEAYVFVFSWDSQEVDPHGFTILRFSSTGSLLQQKTILDPLNELGGGDEGMALTPSGNIVLFYTVSGEDNPDPDLQDVRGYQFVELTPDLEIVWQKVYSRPGYRLGTSGLAVDSSGDIWVCGLARQLADDFGCHILKLNSAGERLFSKRWLRDSLPGENLYTWPQGIALDAGRNAVVIGQVVRYHHEPGDTSYGFMLKINEFSSLIWQREWASNSAEPVRNVSLPSGGSILAHARESDFGSLLLMNFDLQGNLDHCWKYSESVADVDLDSLPGSLATGAYLLGGRAEVIAGQWEDYAQTVSTPQSYYDNWPIYEYPSTLELGEASGSIVPGETPVCDSPAGYGDMALMWWRPPGD